MFTAFLCYICNLFVTIHIPLLGSLRNKKLETWICDLNFSFIFILTKTVFSDHLSYVTLFRDLRQWFSRVSPTNKTDRHDITEILLKVALNTTTPNLSYLTVFQFYLGRSHKTGLTVLKNQDGLIWNFNISCLILNLIEESVVNFNVKQKIFTNPKLLYWLCL
jgi:hypothetical protein